MMSLPLRLTALAAACAAAAAYTCADDDGCERLGSCVDGACQCRRGFTGPSCGLLDLAPALSQGPALQWPADAVNAAQFASAWGFSVVHDPSDGLWHAAATVACGGNGVVADGGGNSWIAHLTSSAGPNGPWSFAAMMVPQTTFGPHLTALADGSFAFIFRVNVLGNTTLCTGADTVPAPASLIASAYVNENEIVSGDPEKGVSIYAATAPRMVGPWTVRRLNITNGGGVHKSNPSSAIPIAPLVYRGVTMNWAMAYRWNTPGPYGEVNAVALAADVYGPYVCTANITSAPWVTSRNSEDPVLWVDPSQPSVGHVLYHNAKGSFHTWGPLDGSAAWRYSPIPGTLAFSTNVTLADGSQLQFQRRERPELLFRGGNVSAGPEWLYSGIVAANNTAFAWAQPFN